MDMQNKDIIVIYNKHFKSYTIHFIHLLGFLPGVLVVGWSYQCRYIAFPPLEDASLSAWTPETCTPRRATAGYTFWWA